MKVKDGIIGLLIGDALGVPVEFKSREYLRENPITGMIGGGTHHQKAGTWSDDTSLTLATMASIVNRKCIDYEDIMQEFCYWLKQDKYCQRANFDVGNTTADALFNYLDGNSALECGGRGERSNGNGSLMRIIPLAYIPDIDYKTIENISALTHAHKRSRIACVLYIEIAKSMIENNDLSIEDYVKNASEKIIEYYEGCEELKHFKRIFNDELDDEDTISSGGYVLDSLESSIFCLKTTDSYRDAVLKAVNLGRDTDTTAAICGGLAGIYYGYDEIPKEWIDAVDKIDQVISFCEEFEKYCDED